ncbi:MAG: cytochrome c biogenesis protein ResB [Pseudomonadota bacterium]
MEAEKISSTDKREEKPLWKFLSSVKLTIFLLIFLAAGSVVGTLIPQNEPPARYVQQYGYSVYRVFDYLSLIDLYHSAWYRILLGLLAVNLVVCTTGRLRHVWQIVFSKDRSIDEKAILARPGKRRWMFESSFPDATTAIQRLLQRKWGSFKEISSGSAVIYWQEKGRFSRLGVYGVHVSIIFFYVAGIASSVGGFRTQINLAEGQAVSQVGLPDSNAVYDLGFILRVDKFEAQFYPSGVPKDYCSQVTVIENQQPVFQAGIRVNDPLSYKGINFYQSSYGQYPKTLKLSIQDRKGGNPLPVSVAYGADVSLPENLGTVRFLRFEPNVMDMGPAVQVFISSPTLGQQGEFWLFKNNPDFGRVKALPYRFIIDGVEEGYYTGLQVAKEPGIFFVWAGSIIMVLGIGVTFFMSHRKVWVVVEKKGDRATVTIGGTANKNKMGLENRLEGLYSEINALDIGVRS